MDQISIGKFISECRKEKHMTQAALAEKLGISDRAVSKWETGRSMPDASIMLDLCELLGITVNDLFNARRITMDNYKEIAEKTMLELRQREESTARRMLTLEIVLGFISCFYLLAMILLATLLNLPDWARALIIVGGSAGFMVGMCFCMKIEQEAGYYACPNCGKRYVPKYFTVFMAPHVNRTRYMRCPHCDKRGWHRKVLVGNEDSLEL